MIDTELNGLCAYINGLWIKGTDEFTSKSPSNLEDTLAVFSSADKSVVIDAYKNAKATLPAWKATPAPVRAEIIHNFGQLVEKNKESLSKCITREIGKPYRESLGSVQEVIDTCHFFVSEGRRLYGQTIPSEMGMKECFTYRRPVGVFGCITACNFPVAVPAWYFVPALVSGNTCVWKPSEDAPVTSYYFNQLLQNSGLPKGVFNLVFGLGSKTGAALVELMDEGCFDKVGFTGSTAIGKKIGEVCGRNLTVPCLELGGKNPMIVTEDADLELALEGAVFSGYATGGQRCTSLGNLILHDSIHDDFLRKMSKMVESLTIGDPQNEKSFYGPLISEKFLANHKEHLNSLIENHHELPLGRGGQISSTKDWSNFLGDPSKGLYVKPVIVANVKDTDPIYSTETFGPIFNVLKYNDFDEAIALANDHGFGLSSSIYSTDVSKIYKFKENINAGMSSINNSTVGAEAHLPFGGNGKSGNGGRQSGIWVIDQFTKWHSVNWDMSGKLQKAQMDTAYVEPNLDYTV